MRVNWAKSSLHVCPLFFPTVFRLADTATCLLHGILTMQNEAYSQDSKKAALHEQQLIQMSMTLRTYETK